jgi:uncharacterized integral membrane protein
MASDEPEDTQEPKEPELREAPVSASHAPSGKVPDVVVPKSRAGQVWTSLVPALILAAVMVAFVIQNRQQAKVSFLVFSGRFPLALALLAAVALGALVVFCLGSVRIVQLRKAFRRHQEHSETTRGER